ncbi:hypothetical protein PR048_023209 [Dryococelus australis]|uniref:Uncharacterized protein n=1 Tax=Dryococelus australis TaxID=614101 RepID=A0ABQ9GTF8_9NEOP|nr:hypothetical protein PR048_023209 [Dryococelus australis]
MVKHGLKEFHRRSGRIEIDKPFVKNDPRRIRGGGNGRSPKKPLTSGIVRHDSHLRKSGSDPACNRDGFARGPLVFVRRSMNTEAYCDILDNEMLPTLWRIYGMDPCYFQDDNARCHVSRATMQWYADNNVRRLDWPAQSPDLNPTEHLWDELDRRVRVRQTRPKSIAQLTEWLQEEWRRACQTGSDLKSERGGANCAKSQDSHSEGPGFDSRSGNTDFGFPLFPEITPGECWDGSLTKKGMADSFPFLPQSLFPVQLAPSLMTSLPTIHSRWTHSEMFVYGETLLIYITLDRRVFSGYSHPFTFTHIPPPASEHPASLWVSLPRRHTAPANTARHDKNCNHDTTTTTAPSQEDCSRKQSPVLEGSTGSVDHVPARNTSQLADGARVSARACRSGHVAVLRPECTLLSTRAAAPVCRRVYRLFTLGNLQSDGCKPDRIPRPTDCSRRLRSNEWFPVACRHDGAKTANLWAKTALQLLPRYLYNYTGRLRKAVLFAHNLQHIVFTKSMPILTVDYPWIMLLSATGKQQLYRFTPDSVVLQQQNKYYAKYIMSVFLLFKLAVLGIRKEGADCIDETKSFDTHEYTLPSSKITRLSLYFNTDFSLLHTMLHGLDRVACDSKRNAHFTKTPHGTLHVHRNCNNTGSSPKTRMNLGREIGEPLLRTHDFRGKISRPVEFLSALSQIHFRDWMIQVFQVSSPRITDVQYQSNLILIGQLDSTVLCTREPQLFVNWLMPQCYLTPGSMGFATCFFTSLLLAQRRRRGSSSTRPGGYHPLGAATDLGETSYWLCGGLPLLPLNDGQAAMFASTTPVRLRTSVDWESRKGTLPLGSPSGRCGSLPSLCRHPQGVKRKLLRVKRCYQFGVYNASSVTWFPSLQRQEFGGEHSPTLPPIPSLLQTCVKIIFSSELYYTTDYRLAPQEDLLGRVGNTAPPLTFYGQHWYTALRIVHSCWTKVLCVQGSPNVDRVVEGTRECVSLNCRVSLNLPAVIRPGQLACYLAVGKGGAYRDDTCCITPEQRKLDYVEARVLPIFGHLAEHRTKTLLKLPSVESSSAFFNLQSRERANRGKGKDNCTPIHPLYYKCPTKPAGLAVANCGAPSGRSGETNALHWRTARYISEADLRFGRLSTAMWVIEVSMVQRRNERAREKRDPRENPPTNGIVRHDSYMRRSGDPAGDRARFALVGGRRANRSATAAPYEASEKLKVTVNSLYTLYDVPYYECQLSAFGGVYQALWAWRCVTSHVCLLYGDGRRQCFPWIIRYLPALALRTNLERFGFERKRVSCSRSGVSEEIWTALDIEGGGNGRPSTNNPPTNGIVRHDSHMRKSGGTRPGIEPESPWWEARRLTAQPPGPPRSAVRVLCSGLRRTITFSYDGFRPHCKCGMGRGANRIFACGKRGGHCRCLGGFSRVIPFPPPLHSCAAQSLPHFTLTVNSNSYA